MKNAFIGFESCGNGEKIVDNETYFVLIPMMDPKKLIDAQIEQIKLDCTIWVPRLLPEEIYEYTKKKKPKPVKLNKIGERHYEIDESSDSEPITISLSDTESDDPPSIPSAADESIAEYINTNISPKSPATIVETSSETHETQANVSLDNFILEDVPIDKNSNALVETVSEVSTVTSASSIATTAADASDTKEDVLASSIDAPVTTTDALDVGVNVPDAVTCPPANNEIGVITPNPAFHKTSTTFVEVAKDGVAPISKNIENEISPILIKLLEKKCIFVKKIPPVENQNSSLTIADMTDKTLKSNDQPSNLRDDLSMPALNDNNLIAKDPIPITSESPTTLPSLAIENAIPIIQRSSNASPSVPTTDAVPVSSQLSTASSSLAAKDAVPTSSQFLSLSSSLPRMDAAPITKIRVKSTQDLGVTDPESGTNFLNETEANQAMEESSVTNSDISPTIDITGVDKVVEHFTKNLNSTDKFIDNISKMALNFKLLFKQKKQYDRQRRKLLKNLHSSTSSSKFSNDKEIELQVLQDQHERSVRGYSEEIISELGECVGYTRLNIILSQVFQKSVNMMSPQLKKLECVENISQMWLDLIDSEVYSVSSLIKIIPREQFKKDLSEVFLYFDKTTPSRKRVFPSMSKPVATNRTMCPPQPLINTVAANRNSSLGAMANNTIPAELPSRAIENRINDSHSQRIKQAYENIIVQTLNDIPSRGEVTMTANQLRSNAIMNPRSQDHLYSRQPPPYSRPIVNNEHYFTNGTEVFRQAVRNAVVRPSGSGQLFSGRYPYVSVPSNVALFQPSTVHSPARLPPSNYSSLSRLETLGYSPHSSQYNTPNRRQISSYSPTNYPSSISPSHSNSHSSIHHSSNYNSSYNSVIPSQAYTNQNTILQHQSSHRPSPPRAVPYNANFSHQNPMWNDQQIQGGNFNEPGRNYMSCMNNSVVRQNMNSAAVTAIPMQQQVISQHNYARTTMQRPTQHVSPIQCDHTNVVLPEIESSQHRSSGPSQQIDLTFSSFANNENLVVRGADSTLSPSTGPSPNPIFTNEMPLSVPIVQSTSSPSVDQLYELEGLDTIGQPLKDSEMQELILTNLNIHFDTDNEVKNQNTNEV